MPTTRTQVHLTPEQSEHIDEIASVEGVTSAEIVQRALDAYLSSHSLDATSVLERTFGTVPDICAVSRDEWQRG